MERWLTPDIPHFLPFQPDSLDTTDHSKPDYVIQMGSTESISAGEQPRLIQGIRRRDGVGEDQETTA